MKNVYVVILYTVGDMLGGQPPRVLGVFTSFEKALELKEKYEAEFPLEPVIYEVPLDGVVTSGKMNYWKTTLTKEGIKFEKKEFDLDKIWAKEESAEFKFTPEQKKKIGEIFTELAKGKEIEDVKDDIEELVKSVDPEKWKEWKKKYKEFKRKIKS